MKVLFLDIDGVCNSVYTWQKFDGFQGIDPEMAARVRRIVAETDCKVVLSSTWRLDRKSRAHVREAVCDFIGVTPDLPNETRGAEVSAWLSKHSTVSRHACLDDQFDFEPHHNLFRTSSLTGLTEEITEDVIDYLNARVTA